MREITTHVATRMAERNIDEITYSILDVYGERLGKRQGVTLSKETADELIDMALSFQTRNKFKPVISERRPTKEAGYAFNS